MKKVIKWGANFIIFSVMWWIKLVIVTGLSFAYVTDNQLAPSNFIAIGSIVTFFTSFMLARKINSSNLWKRLFK